jgi:cytochrome c oxidase cbb3-type subunit 3
MKRMLAAFLGLGIALAGCERERRDFATSTAATAQAWAVPADGRAAPPLPTRPSSGVEVQRNAYSLNEGRTLYDAFNCTGCHAHGGGGMGPALMDAKWIYGSDLPQIFATIMNGRPNGMPAFRGKLAEYQAWQIAGYVRSLSGLVPFTAAPGRRDHMKANPPENSVDPVRPRPPSPPPPP